MASHQHKRPYTGSQPSITSYFSHAISPTSTHQPTYSCITPSTPQPERVQLPANIQSNLLSVGMRVRKSVPEGYKTGSYSGFTLFSDDAPVVKAEVHHNPQRNRPRARELTPFCGILKVGGMAQQQWGIYNPGGNQDAMVEEEEDDYMPALSQGSTISNDSASMPGERKRRMDFDDADESEEQGEDARERVILRLGERAIAVPRRKKVGKVGGVAIMGQENAGGDFDFADADFLDYGLMGDAEMGGV